MLIRVVDLDSRKRPKTVSLPVIALHKQPNETCTPSNYTIRTKQQTNSTFRAYSTLFGPECNSNNINSTFRLRLKVYYFTTNFV